MSVAAGSSNNNAGGYRVLLLSNPSETIDQNNIFEQKVIPEPQDVTMYHKNLTEELYKDVKYIKEKTTITKIKFDSFSNMVETELSNMDSKFKVLEQKIEGNHQKMEANHQKMDAKLQNLEQQLTSKLDLLLMRLNSQPKD